MTTYRITIKYFAIPFIEINYLQLMLLVLRHKLEKAEYGLAQPVQLI